MSLEYNNIQENYNILQCSWIPEKPAISLEYNNIQDNYNILQSWTIIKNNAWRNWKTVKIS